MSAFDKVAAGRQTFMHEADYPLRHDVPEHQAAHYKVQSHEFAARELYREGYSAEAIGRALQIDVRAVRKIIGAEL